MKRTLSLIALVAICSAMMISCKNKQSEPTPEEIEAQKVALADSVLAKINALVDDFIIASTNGILFRTFELTEEEKLIKPDYLLDPSFANTLVTKSQKVNALAFYIVDLGVRSIYGMQLEETKEVIAKLAADVNYPYDIEQQESRVPVSELIRNEYNYFKERGDVAYFWKFQNAILREISYILSKDTDLFFSRITDEQIVEVDNQWDSFIDAVKILADYDDEMKLILDSFYIPEDREIFDNEYFASKDSTIKIYKSNMLNTIEKRNALLQ